MPGVYWFSDSDGTVLYVGKAKNLKNRVRSYTQLKQLSNRIRQLTVTAKKLTFSPLESELEALLVEAELIHTYQPHFNVLLKDDKSPLYIQITAESFPTVRKIRKKEIISQQLKGTILGPFPSAYKVSEVLKIARNIFPWCSKGAPRPGARTVQPCFYYHLQLCPGVCTGAVARETYAETMRQLTLFLKGKKREVITHLEAQMKTAVTAEQFEEAALLRDKIVLIKEVTGTSYRLKPDFTLPALQADVARDGQALLQKLLSTYSFVPTNYPLTRIEGYDVSNTQGTNAAVAMVTFIAGKPEKSEYKLFNIRTLTTPNDYHMMKEALARRQNHPEWGKPDLVVVDGGKGQIRAALQVWQWRIPIIGIAKHPDRLIIPIFKQPPVVPVKTITYHVASLSSDNAALKLIQQLRDEAHRFSKKQHSRRRTRALLE